MPETLKPELHWLTPDWSMPAFVRGFVSTRKGQWSQPPYDGFNTANHVGDDPDSVQQCRNVLKRLFGWKTQAQWLKQVHSATVVDAQDDNVEREADAVITSIPGRICTLHTADCLPVFFAAKSGATVALVHAGWRGLADGILESTLKCFPLPSNDIAVWLGPAISQAAFEVGPEVREAFVAHDPDATQAFLKNERGRWQADLYALARMRLQSAGVQTISGGEYCTYQDTRFFSYRRQPVTGRMVSLLWIDPAQKSTHLLP